MSPRPSSANEPPKRERRGAPALTIAVISALVVAALYFAQAVLISFALAVLLTFLLSPAVSYLQRLRLSRGAAVALVIVLAFCALGAAGWVVSAQIGALASELPKYRHNIAEKVRYVRSMGKGGVLENVQETVKDLQGELDGDQRIERTKPSPVASPPSFDFASMAQIIGMATLVLGLVIFMLAQREELRNRLIRVIGYAHLTVTTRALEDAGRRISNYLLMQVTINGCFGLIVAIALFLIGLPYAFLWGFLAVPLLFIPVFGFWTAAALPTILSLAVFREWWWPVAVIGLFFGLKTIINMILEPLLYGRSVGVFPVPLLVMIAFWTWLWGGIGLLLATPMTVCLVVFARHVPQLESVRVLLSDEPAMEPKISFYQRLLAVDTKEAGAILRRYLEEHSREEAYDEIVLPALSFAKSDLRENKITGQEHQFVMTATRQILKEGYGLAGETGNAPVHAAAADAKSTLTANQSASGSGKIVIVGCPAQTEADEIALLMFQQLLNPARYEIEILASGGLAAEVAVMVAEKTPPLVLIGAVAPGGLSQVRHICKRLRGLSRDVKIVVGWWQPAANSRGFRESLKAIGADQVGGSLSQTRDQITNMRPFISQTQTDAQSREAMLKSAVTSL
jgi:predicted PurR-regulated permease PerM